jgi:hypothetical protein
MTKASSDAARKLARLSNAKGMTKARKIACRRNLAKGRKLRWKKNKGPQQEVGLVACYPNAQQLWRKVPKRQKGWLPVE